MEQSKLDRLMTAMIEYYNGDPKRIQHFIKVHSLCRMIGIGEKLDDVTQFTLEAAGLVHDIGIRAAEKKYGYSNGKLQETEGPQPAEDMLYRLGFSPEIRKRVCWLVAHHHTYDKVEGMDYRILLEADFLVNLYEEHAQTPAILAAYDNIFRTETGKYICKTMFGFSD